MKMKMIMLAGMIIVTAALFTGVSAQEPTTGGAPPVADNASPADNNIKLRSVELERIKRDAEKTATLRREDGKELKFSIVKDDFEGIQKEQNLIIEAYTKSKTIDYEQINKSSNLITEMAVRLRANVFTLDAEEEKGDGEAEENNPYTGKSLRDLIIDLDNAIGDVVSNPMWQKLAVVDPETSESVETSLIKVINASSALWLESTKLKKK